MKAVSGVLLMTLIVVLALATRVVLGLEGTNEAAEAASSASSSSSSLLMTEPLVSRPEFGSRNESWLELQKWLMYAYSAYCTEGLTNWTCYWCTMVNSNDVYPLQVANVFYDSGTDTYGYLGISNDSIVVGFRGTNDLSIENWLTDFAIWQQVSYPNVSNGGVAVGFHHAYQTIADQVLSAVQAARAKYPAYPIVATGHSLGGALAVMCALNLIENKIEGVYVWSFGQPRVGNHILAGYINEMIPSSNMRRVINKDDIVPHWPSQILDFKHAPTELWFPPIDSNKNDTYFVLCSTTDGEDPHCSDGVLADSISDHLGYLGYHQPDGHQHGCGN